MLARVSALLDFTGTVQKEPVRQRDSEQAVFVDKGKKKKKTDLWHEV